MTLFVCLLVYRNCPASVHTSFINLIDVYMVFSGKRDAGIQEFTIDGSQLANGVYFCEIRVNNQPLIRKLLLQK